MLRSMGRRLRRSIVLAGAALAPIACGGGGDDGPTGGNQQGISIAATPAALTVQQGGSGQVNVQLSRAGGFSGTVTVAITGLPAGITTTITPSQLTGATTAASVAVDVAATVAPGQYTATVTASGTGVSAATASYQVTVTAAPAYTLAITPTALTIAQGSTATTAVAIARTNFGGAVNLALGGAPAGVTGTFNPASPTTDASQLSVAVAPNVAPGTYNLTVTGTATGLADRTAALQLTVTAAAGYTLALSPATVNSAPGGTATSTVNVTRDAGFVGAVTLTVDNPPAGFTATFNPTSVTTAQSTMTVNVGAGIQPGNYTLTVRGTATGLADRTAQLTVVVSNAAFSVTPTPNAVTIQQGGAGTSAIAIGRTNFTGNVTLSLDNPPPGVTGTFAPGTTNGTTSTLTLNVAANVAPGNYILTVRGTAAGQVDRVANITLTVTSAPGSIAIALSAPAITVQQGTSGQVGVNVTRTNFPGNITFAATNVPAGVTIAFNPATTTASASTATITVAQGATVGTTPITVTASGTGVANATAAFNLTITSPTSGSNSVWQFCSAADTPVFFAYQDGTGAWQRVMPAVSGTTTTFSFSITANRGGVAYIRANGSVSALADASTVSSHSKIRRAQALLDAGRTQRRASLLGARAFAPQTAVTRYETEVIYGTATELTTLGTDNCGDTQPTKTINGTVAGVGAGQFADVSLGGSSVFVIGGQGNAVQFANVPFGAVDLVGTRSTAGGLPDKVVLQRNLNIPDGGALPALIDFNANSAFAPATAAATITNSLGDELFLSSLFFTANGETGFFSREQAFSTNPARTWSGVPNAQLVNGDLHGLFLFASPDFDAGTVQRYILRYTTQVAAQTLALGPNLDLPTATPLALGANPRFRFTGALPQEYRSALTISLSDTFLNANQYNITVTGGYLAIAGSTSTFDVVMPDIASLNGFPAGSGLLQGANDAMITAIGWNGSGILSLRPRAGDVMRAAVRVVTVNVP